MFKKVVSLLLVTCLCLTGCSAQKTSSVSTNVDKKYAAVIKESAKRLYDTHTNYIVATTVESPSSVLEYIEVKNEGNSYTEYSVDSDGNMGTLQYGSASTISYSLTDWLTADNKYYIFSNDGVKDVIYTLPETYNKYVSDRAMLYANTIVDNAISIEPYEDIEMDLGQGSEVFKSYKVKLGAETVKEILGVSSYGIYKSIMDDAGVKSNIGKLCSYYLEDLDMDLTFSTANVIFGIDSDNILKYVCLETGGLGTRLYYTKVVADVRNSNVRTMPDVTSAVAYSTTLTDLADFVSGYDNYEDAKMAISNLSSDSFISEEHTHEHEEESITVTESVINTEESTEYITEEESIISEEE